MAEKDTVRVNVSPEVAALAERETRRGIRWRNGPVAALGLFGVIGGASFFIDPNSVDLSPIGRNLNSPADDLWSAAWLVGGLMVVVGAMRPWQLLELIGYAIYVPALVAYAVAVIVLTAYTPPAIFLALSVAAAGVAKMVYLMVYAPTVTRVRVERRRDSAPAHDDAYGGKERRG